MGGGALLVMLRVEWSLLLMRVGMGSAAQEPVGASRTCERGVKTFINRVHGGTRG
jgi:hypothetical protein